MYPSRSRLASLLIVEKLTFQIKSFFGKIIDQNCAFLWRAKLALYEKKLFVLSIGTFNNILFDGDCPVESYIFWRETLGSMLYLILCNGRDQRVLENYDLRLGRQQIMRYH